MNSDVSLKKLESMQSVKNLPKSRKKQ